MEPKSTAYGASLGATDTMDIIEEDGNQNDASRKYSQSLNSSNGSINSTGTGLSVAMKKAPASVSTTNTITLGESPESMTDKNGGLMNSFRSLTTGYDNRNGFSNDSSVKEINSNGTEMLTYRKSKRKQHSRSISSTSNIDKSLPELPSTPKLAAINPTIDDIKTPSSFVQGEYDKTLYVDEKYLDTQYRYATEKRDSDFHTLFTSVPSTDRLLDDFSCALSREILLQGRIYISEHYICFNSSLLGWVTSLVISHDDILKFEKRSTAGLFPNGIVMETKDSLHTFASFLTRDQTLNFMETIWSKSVALSKLNHEESREIDIIEARSSIGGLSEQDIFTIDGDSSSSEDNDLSGEEENSSVRTDDSMTAVAYEKTPIVKQESDFEKNLYPGPKMHKPTSHIIDYKKNNETIVLEQEFDVPLGFLYKIYFGQDTSLHKKVLELNDAFDFTDYGGLETEKKRAFEYEKGLNYPIGPKSTRVFTEEIVENLDFENYVEVLSISKTPNVPSGTAFDCRTRSVLTWGDNNKTKVTISFYLNWTGSSWFKGVIESSALSGQQKAGNDVKLVLEEGIEQRRGELETKVNESKKRKSKPKVTTTKQTPSKVAEIVPSTIVKPSVSDDVILLKLKMIVKILLLSVILEFIIIIILGWNQYKLFKLIDHLK